jgi:hypothetical protein
LVILLEQKNAASDTPTVQADEFGGLPQISPKQEIPLPQTGQFDNEEAALHRAEEQVRAEGRGVPPAAAI